MKFRLAAELQRRLVECPPSGWVATKEAGLLTPEITQILGYRPSVDLLFQSKTTRDWISANPFEGGIQSNQEHFF